MIILRKQAKIDGLKRYFTGAECSRGHIAERITSTAECVVCKRSREDSTKAAKLEYMKQRYKDNREQLLAAQNSRDQLHRTKKVEYGRTWRKLNGGYAVAYRLANAALYAYHSSMRRARLIRATPMWHERDQIKHLYITANELNLEVDHIVPLVHPLVCGLHCLANLQLISKSENLIKKNTFTIN